MRLNDLELIRNSWGALAETHCLILTAVKCPCKHVFCPVHSWADTRASYHCSGWCIATMTGAKNSFPDPARCWCPKVQKLIADWLLTLLRLEPGSGLWCERFI